jgi:hypothetical protein
LTRHEGRHLRRSAAIERQETIRSKTMDQTLTHDTLVSISAGGWMSYEEFVEEFWEMPPPRTRPTAIAIIPEDELPW